MWQLLETAHVQLDQSRKTLDLIRKLSRAGMAISSRLLAGWLKRATRRPTSRWTRCSTSTGMSSSNDDDDGLS